MSESVPARIRAEAYDTPAHKLPWLLPVSPPNTSLAAAFDIPPLRHASVSLLSDRPPCYHKQTYMLAWYRIDKVRQGGP